MNPLLEITGQIAAIIICLFVFILLLLSLAFNLAMVFGMSWLSEKIQAIKLLRPTVENVNKATESALQGTPPDETQHRMIRTAASIPTAVHNLEKKVDQGTEKVADAVIEFRARTVQAKTILKAFFLPGLMPQKLEKPIDDEASRESNSPDYQMLERPAAIPVASPPNNSLLPPAEQVQHATTH